MNEQPGTTGRFARVILAAGQSLRMGEPKALLPLGDRNVIERVIEAAGSIVELTVVVANPLLADALGGPGAGGGGGFELVLNTDPGSEQIDSLRLGIERMISSLEEPPDGFFLHPVDYPLVGEEDYRALRAAFSEPPGTGIDVFQPVFAERHGHPVLCRYSLASRFLELSAGGTARDVIRSCPRGYVPTSNPGVVEDMDTPEDYSRLLGLIEGGEAP